eukprot:TRINITY_DN196_c0_g1_i1.p1 TRINITY_DN196_c0_g1~~TRINITY_DN196_c0_g1_i1.p1  ORF type:complete len:343 (+),score=60.24 TRINITY_DN196_c0_g1_i1:65-1030(+)
MAVVAALMPLCIGSLACPAGVDPACVAVIGTTARARQLSFSHDDTLLAVGGRNGLTVHNLTAGTTLSVPTYSSARHVAFSPDASAVAVTVGGPVAVVNVGSGNEVWSDSSKGGCYCVAYSPGGAYLATGHVSGGLHIWNATDGTPVSTLVGHSTAHYVYDLAYSPDGTKIVSGSRNGSVIVWDASTGAVLKTLTDHAYHPFGFAVSQDGQYFVTESENATNNVQIHRFSDYGIHRTITFPSFVYDLDISHDSSAVVVAGTDGYAREYSVSTGDLLHEYDTGSTNNYGVAYMRQRNEFVTVTYDLAGHILLFGGATPSPPTP